MTDARKEKNIYSVTSISRAEKKAVASRYMMCTLLWLLIFLLIGRVVCCPKKLEFSRSRFLRLNQGVDARKLSYQISNLDMFAECEHVSKVYFGRIAVECDS